MENPQYQQLSLFPFEEGIQARSIHWDVSSISSRLNPDRSYWSSQKATLGLLRHNMVKDLTLTDEGVPLVKAYKGDYPIELIDIVKINRYKGYRAWLNGFSEDIVLDRIWRKPEYYLKKIPIHGGFIAPDFSVKVHMSTIEKKFNLYRRNVLAALAQKVGIPTIVPLSWAEYDTLDYCFEAIEPGGIYAISNIGIRNNYISRKLFRVGFQEAVRVLEPKGFILYGYPVENTYGIETRVYNNENIRRLRGLRS